MIDLHAHILPGLDDGPVEMVESIQMCRMAYQDGVRSIVATPHMNDGMYNVTSAQAREAAQSLNDALAREGVDMRILPGGDVALTPETLEKLERDEISTVASNGKYVMLELPSDVVPVRLHEAIFSIQSAGYFPIISHIERNYTIQSSPRMAEKIVEWGALTQITAGSIVGEFGSSAKKCARELIKSRLGHVVASDMHRMDKRPPGRMSPARRAVEGMISGDEVEMIFVNRPEAIVRGEILEVPDPVSQETVRKWWKIWQ